MSSLTYTITSLRHDVEVKAVLDPRVRNEVANRPLAVALLEQLNAKQFAIDLTCDDERGVHRVEVFFSEPEDQDDLQVIIAAFTLRVPDHKKILTIMAEAQEFLTVQLTAAVDTFNTVLAVGSVTPYIDILRRHNLNALTGSKEVEAE